MQPPPEVEKPLRIFTLFVGALPAVHFDEFATKDDPFYAEERKVFVKLAETFKLVPKGSAYETAVKDTSTSPGGNKVP